MHKGIRSSLFIFLIFFALPLYAKDLGTISDVYVIKETDLLVLIQSRLQMMKQSGQLEKIEAAMQQRAIRYRDRPTPVSGVTKAVESKTWLFDPSITLNQDVVSPDGLRIAPRGIRVNPLSRISLSKTLIFIDGDDDDQIKWVKNQIHKLHSHLKVILTKGSVLSTEDSLGMPVFFDQEGRLVKRFKINHVPAAISQKGLQLEISEVRV